MTENPQTPDLTIARAMDKLVRIAGASGYWGDCDMAVPQFLADGRVDYIVFDYLAEITMSIMARSLAKNPEAGYATDFVSQVLKPNLPEIARQNIKIISNAGGVNPGTCGRAVQALVRELGLDLKVAVVTGDNLMDRAEEFSSAQVTEMFSNEAFPSVEKVASINAYLGAFPIARALDAGADIVITGRCVDSAVTLGACIHEFKWTENDLDALAGASLAGHILECGPQATGGNFTDWKTVADSLHNIGYPIAEIAVDGTFVCTKPQNTGGVVSKGTVAEQLLYEIGDPQAYLLPDVVCDFSQVTLSKEGEDRIRVAGAVGHPAPDRYKVCATYSDGWRAGTVVFFYGEDAAAKARLFADSVLLRSRSKLRANNAPDFSEVLTELVGDESEFGAFAQTDGARSVALKIAVKHPEAHCAELFLKEATGQGLAAAPGLSNFAGGRSRPSPVLRLFSFTFPKSEVPITVTLARSDLEFGPEKTGQPFNGSAGPKPVPPPVPAAADMVEIPLAQLAWLRSGDKGDKANIGVIPRDIAYAPWIWAALTEEVVAARFAHFLSGSVERFYLPGIGAMNILMHEVLGGGGVASLRNDPQGKGYSQLLLGVQIPLPQSLVGNL